MRKQQNPIFDIIEVEQEEKMIESQEIAGKKGAFVKTEDFLKAYYENLEPKLAYDPELTERKNILWKNKVVRKLEELMKLPDNGDRSGESDIVWEKEYDDYRIEKHIIYPEPYSAVPFLVMIPKDAGQSNRVPGVLCISGSSGTKEMLCGEPELDGKPTSNKHPGHNKMAWHFVKAGYAAVAVENPGVGELKKDEADIWGDRSDFAGRMMMAGRSYVGMSVHQKLCILEWMKDQKYITSTKLAACGHSLGAEPAIMLSLISHDIKALIYNDFIGNRLKRKTVLKRGEKIGGLWHEIPDMFEWFTYIDLMAAVAPMPALYTEGGVTADIDIVRSAYEKRKQPERLAVHYYDKYENPEKRLHEYEDIPSDITMDEYYEYANIDVENHYFKENHAIPWLNKVFK
jgi:dienelactone hydrolase